MSSSLELYILLIVVGLFLIIIEVLIPGGIVGVFGVLSLMGAAMVGFSTFGAEGGFLSAIALVFLGSIVLFAWLKLFPKTAVGRRLTLATDGKTFKSSTEENKSLIGSEGVAEMHLRPAGIALVNGRRIDVVTESNFIENGSRVKVIASEGNRVVVREVKYD